LDFTHFTLIWGYLQNRDAPLLIISLIKQKLTLAVALSKVLSKLLVRILHLSIQAFAPSIIHLALSGTNPDLPWPSFCFFDGFSES